MQPRHGFARRAPNYRPLERTVTGAGRRFTEHLMHRYVIPVCGCVAVMMTAGEPALARSHHHRQHWTLRHSHHHSLRSQIVSHHAYRGRSMRHLAVAQPYAPMAAQSVEGPFAWQSPQPATAPMVRSRRGQRVAATAAGWQMASAPAVMSQPAIAPAPVAPYGAAASGWQAPEQQAVARRRGATVAPNQTQFASLVSSHAQANGVPESLVHRVIMRESRYNPRAVSRGNYGMMQIRLGTARAMGYTGSAAGLLDPNTNMTYAVRYLAGAYRAAGGNHNRAVAYYAGGYYHAAKRQGLSPYAAQARAAARVPTAVPAMVPTGRVEMF
jgi:soluble lytic murein transglycosylase-like protein